MSYQAPKCRSGHGAMRAQSHAGSDWFGVQSVLKNGSFSVGPAIVVRLYVCEACGYIEMQDVPQDEFDAAINDAERAGDANG